MNLGDDLLGQVGDQFDLVEFVDLVIRTEYACVSSIRQRHLGLRQVHMGGAGDSRGGDVPGHQTDGEQVPPRGVVRLWAHRVRL